MSIFRNNSSQNVNLRGMSVGGKQPQKQLPRYFEAKFMHQISITPSNRTKAQNPKIDQAKLPTLKQSDKYRDKQNKTPYESKLMKSFIRKAPEVHTKVRGLHNIGNTCYLNSTLQCLLHLSRFNQALYRGEHKKGIDRPFPASDQYQAIVKQLIDSTSISPINPCSFKMTIGKQTPRFIGNSQQDAQEFLTAVLQCMNDELSRVKTKPKYQQLGGDPTKKPLQQISQQWWDYNKKRDDSIICDYFTGQILSKVICKKCKAVSVTFDNVWGMPLSLTKGHKTIPQLLQAQLKNQNLIEDYNCANCKKLRDCSRTLQFFRLPEVLVIQLKRFEYGRWSKQKIKDAIRIEKQIEMKHFLANQSIEEQTQYKLTGVVHHFGQTDFGHYTAQVFNHQNSKWYDANDSKISGVGSVQGSSRSVYLLFYEKKTKN